MSQSNDDGEQGWAKLRRTRLLTELAKEGASRCWYMPGAGNPDAWPESRCDCKYLGPAGVVRHHVRADGLLRDSGRVSSGESERGLMPLSRSDHAPTLRDRAVEAVYNQLLDPDMNAWDRQRTAEAFADAVLAEIQMLTPHEARALRLASIFGTPTPTPPEIASALEKIKQIEAEHA